MTLLRMAVIGAGPAGLALALLAATRLPGVEVTVFDARPADRDVGRDPRTLALAWGSVMLLKQLQAWPQAQAAPIDTVHVSQAPPSWGHAEVRIRAREMGVPMLGAVIAYGPLVAGLQRAWDDEVARQGGPARRSRFGAAVTDVEPAGDGVDVRWDGGEERFDLAVIAEGGVFGAGMGQRADNGSSGRTLVRDYGQTAWVGTVSLDGAQPGTAFERFTRHGPVALLPLDTAGTQAALVWCVAGDDDPVAGLTDAQRRAVLGTLLPRQAGRITGISTLQRFALGLKAQATLVHGRVVRIGNAAQTLHPVAGQGLNLGLRDAQSLVQSLIHLPSPGTVEAALRRVEWARASDRWTTMAATDFLARSFTWRAPGMAAARGGALKLLDLIGPAKTALARRMMFGQR